MADAALVSLLLKELSTLIHEELSLLGGLRNDAEDIKNDLELLKAGLKDVDKMEEIDSQVEAWVKIVRDLAYDTEDVLEEFLFRFGGRRIGGGFYTEIQKMYTSVKNFRARRRLALALRRIKDRFNKYSQYQQRFPTSSMGNVHNHNKWWHDSRRDALSIEESDLVGIEDHKRSLVNLLLADDDDLRVHSVVGMGGLGKTTLVKKAYDVSKVINHFQLRAWVTVSETFKIEELLKNAIKQLVKQIKQDLPRDFEAMHSDELREFMNNILSGQSYIIVLDDIWDVDAWNAIKYAFPKQSFGSRIVITTRNREIANSASHETRGTVYSLTLLSPEDSMTLFCRKTFLKDACPPHLVNISKNILKRCDGLPLAIVVIAGVLASKGEGIEDWERFDRSLNIQLISNVNMKSLKNLLSLSYYDLPYYLKYCFLYLSIFPEDAIIQKRRIIQLWIAEGFVEENSQVKEEVAEGYLNELLHRNLIQIETKTCAGRIKSFRVHDILRQIILSKSAEQNFAIIATGQETEPSNKFRRLAIHRFDENTPSKKHLRSLHLFTDDEMVSSSLSKLLSFDYIPLKVLDLTGAKLEEIPKEVFNLFHLKYLSLRSTRLRNIPKSIGRLQNLEILDLKYTYYGTELPVEIVKLHKLWHLIVGSRTYGLNSPSKIGGLLSLQKLYYINADKTDGIRVVSEIGKLTQLRKLGVRNLRQEDGRELCSSLEKLTNLCSLSLELAILDEENEILDIQHSLSTVRPLCLHTLKLIGRLERVPQWLSSLASLTKLYLWYSLLLEDPLPLLQDLPMLAHLHLHVSYNGERLCFKAGKFSKLKFLNIQYFRALKWIMVEEGATPLLEELYLVDCKLLEQLPLGIERLSKLKSIEFNNMPDKLMLTLDPNGENYTKISHIPHIKIIKW